MERIPEIDITVGRGTVDITPIGPDGVQIITGAGQYFFQIECRAVPEIDIVVRPAAGGIDPTAIGIDRIKPSPRTDQFRLKIERAPVPDIYRTVIVGRVEIVAVREDRFSVILTVTENVEEAEVITTLTTPLFKSSIPLRIEMAFLLYLASRSW